MITPSLKIIDRNQDDQVDLLSLTGWSLKEWKPSIAEPKGGGVFRSSPLVDGRRLAYKKLDNITDTFNLIGNAESQDLMITSIQNLQRLLEKATSYWTSNWQNEPIIIEAKASLESNPRYATVIDYRLSGFGGPFEQPFFSTNCNSATEAILVIEHTLWQESIPGEDGECVELFNTTEFPAVSTYNTATYSPNAAASDVTYDPDLGLDGFADTELYVGSNASFGTRNQFGVIFHTVNIPASATLLKATLHMHEVGFVTADAVNIKIDGQSQGRGAINSTTITNGGSGYVSPIVYVYSQDGNGYGANIQAIVVGGVVTELNIISGGRGYINPTILIRDVPGGRGVGATATCTATAMDFDAVDFTTVADYLSRERTDAYVNFFVEEDTVIPTSIDITEIIAEIIGNDYWTSGDNVGLFVQLHIGMVSGTGREIYSFDHGADYPQLILEWSTQTQEVGRDATCAPEVFITNKLSKTPLNFIYCYDADNGGDKYSPNMYGWDYSATMPLFQDNAATVITPAVGDMLYFGSCPYDAQDKNFGPFTNIVLDLYSRAIGIQGIWEYYNVSTAWTAFNVSGDAALNELCGDQTTFQNEGVGSIVYEAQSDWGQVSINGSEIGFWIRFRVTAVATPTSPYQWHRDIYTALNPYSEISAGEVPGDIPALARVIMESASCVGHSMDTLVLGLRSVSRGDNFRAYLNASNVQNPNGIAFYPSTKYGGTDLEADSTAPTGYSLALDDFSPQSFDVPYYDNSVCSWVISSMGTKEYIGIYHAYVRCIFTTNVGDVKLRLRAVFGEEHNTWYSDWGVIESTGVKVTLDLGQLAIMPSSPVRSSEYLDEITIHLEVYTEDDDNYHSANVFDVILIPADEWCGNFGMPKMTGTAMLQYGYEVDVDGITTPRSYRALQIKKNAHPSESSDITRDVIMADWTRIASGEPIFQQNADQRLWFFQLKHSTNLVARMELCGAVRAERSARYLLARGSR